MISGVLTYSSVTSLGKAVGETLRASGNAGVTEKGRGASLQNEREAAAFLGSAVLMPSGLQIVSTHLILFWERNYRGG